MDPGPPDSFTPITPNPFIVGNPIRGRTMFFGREAEFELVRRRFIDHRQGGLLVFCGERRSGKTSILFQIVDGRLGPEFIPVLIDMQSMAITSELDFLGRLTREVIVGLGKPAGIPSPDLSDSTRPPAAHFQTFIEDVLRVHPDRRLVIMFDEYELFENKIDAGVLSADVLRILAALMERQAVALIFTGSQNLEGRRRDYWSILGKSLYKTISYLDPADTMNLIHRPVEGLVRYHAGVAEAILRLTAGQPFYTQAVCQNLVDRLNEVRSRDATAGLVDDVTRDLVENPLPQTIFLWDALEIDDKLVLALLAESLPGAEDRAGPTVLAKAIRQRKYPLQLSIGRMATVLEKLFKQELLLKNDSVASPGYAFRMDLWRLWIRRMHSVWQVTRELGLPHRRPRPAWLATITLAGVGLGVVAAAVVGLNVLRSRSSRTASPAAGGEVGLEVTRSNPTHDSAQGATPVIHEAGGLRVVTLPAGVDVIVDGQTVGKSPRVVDHLETGVPHTVEARGPANPAGRWNPRLSGNGDIGVSSPDGRSMSVRVAPNETALLRLELPTELLVSTTPAGARVATDGSSRGVAPLQLADLNPGPVRLQFSLEGYVPIDTTIDLRPGENAIQATLREEAPGLLIVQGDRLAQQIFVDNALVTEDVQNSGALTLVAGQHSVHVVFRSGEPVDSTFSIATGERVVFDYSRRTVRRSHP